MTDRPSLADLRTRVFKHSGSGREVGNWLARRVGRPTAVYGTWVAVRLGLPAHAVTLAALVANLGGAAAIGSGSRAGFIAGVAFLVIGYWLDHVDGQVARWSKTASLGGLYFDYLLHHATALALGFALGFGVTARGGSIAWAAAGFLVAAGWTGLNLHNDCRYKAMFGRLKRGGRALRVEVGEMDRPTSPPPWPLSWPGVATWPMGKSCEPHVVLMALCGLAVAAMIEPTVWLAMLKIGVATMAFVAPALAVARIAKTIARGELDREFDRLFRPVQRASIDPLGAQHERGEGGGIMPSVYGEISRR